jgi:tetratricopeptide (TPR) repeat protein
MVIEPAYFYPYDTLANTYVVRARWQLWQGQDPQPSVLGTEDVTAQMQELNPRWVWGYSTLGDALEMRARYLVEAGRDPMAVIERARVVYVQADKVSPIPWIDIGQARLDLTEALWLEANGRNASEQFDRALKRLEEAVQGSPEESWAWQSAADVCKSKAAASMARGEPSRKTIEKGLRMVERALDINPTLTEVQAVGANLRLMAAQLESSPSRRAEAERKARQDLQDLLERNGNLRRRYGS